MILIEMDTSQICDMYEHYLIKAFPPDEVRPLESMLKAVSEKRYVCYGYYMNGRLCTYAAMMRMESDVGVDYLGDYIGTREDMRNRGIGRRFLAALMNTLKDPASFLFEIENPDYAPTETLRQLQERRRQFYLRNGVLDTGVNIRIAGVEYRICEIPVGKPHSPEDVLALYEKHYRVMMPPKLFERYFGK